MHFRHKIATEALVLYSFLLYQYLYMPKMCRLQHEFEGDQALTCRSLGHIRTHGFAYICGCLSPSFFFNSDVDVFHEDGSILV